MVMVSVACPHCRADLGSVQKDPLGEIAARVLCDMHYLAHTDCFPMP